MPAGVDELLAYYRRVHDERFRDLPVVNPALKVEAVGMRPLAEHVLGVLITPWFMNLVLLPGSDRWNERPQGSTCHVELPGGKIAFTVAHDDVLGTTLSAALFSTVADFPDQALAREVAAETVRLLFSRPADDPQDGKKTLTRRDLLRRLGGREGGEE